MKISQLTKFLLVLLGGVWLRSSQVQAAITVGADDPMIQYSGRFDFSNPKKPRFDWPGTSIKTLFTGTSVTAIVSGGTNDFNVIIDGVVKSHLALVAGKTIYDLATGLSDGVHTLELYKRTEGFNGQTVFEGLVLADGESLQAPAPRPNRRILFIGDSFTVGYGLEGTGAGCPDRRPLDNNYLAYGPLTARALEAEYSVQAVSGAGMVHNYGDQNPMSAQPLPFFFERTLFGSDLPKWNYASWIPDVVTIALGTNDFSTAVKPTQAQYTTAYKAFIKRIQGYFPNAQIVCLAYPVDSFQGKYVEAMVKELMGQGETKVTAFLMPATTNTGCDGHPNRADHQKLSTALIPILQPFMPVTTAVSPQRGNSHSKEFPRDHFGPSPLFSHPAAPAGIDVKGRMLSGSPVP